MTAVQATLPDGDVQAMTAAEVLALPAACTIADAARALGIGRTNAYALARAGEFPCRVIRAGTRYIVPTTGLHALLGLDTATQTESTTS